MEPNDYQVDGNHYAQHGYQHWDFACDADLHCLIYGATKYASRWRDKGLPVKDLRKTIHFLAKIEERDVHQSQSGLTLYMDRYTMQLCEEDAQLVRYICTNQITGARAIIKKLMNDLVDTKIVDDMLRPERLT